MRSTWCFNCDEEHMVLELSDEVRPLEDEHMVLELNDEVRALPMSTES